MQKMKNSGVPWIGEIPKGWEISKVKYCFTLNVGLSITKENLCLDGIKCLNYGYIHGKNTTELNLDKDHLPFVPTTYLETHSKCLIHNGDFVFCDTSEDIVGSGNFVYILNDCEEKIFAGSHTIACKKTKQFNSSFLAYLCSTDIWKSQIQSKVTGTKVYSITQKILKEALVFFPPLQDQQRIANFLDAKCTQIDDTITKEKELIVKLKEYRQSIITEAVTKGLNPTAPMKDSGINWIGEIPEHWNVSKLKHHAVTIGDGLHGTPVYSEDGEYFFINGNNLRDRKIFIPSHTSRVSSNEFKKYAKNLSSDTLLISLNGTIGKISFYTGEKILLSKSVGYISSIYNVDIHFLAYYLESSNVNSIFEISFSGTTIKNLSLDTLRRLKIMLPALQEQQEITAYLDKKTALIDNAIQKKKELISKLEQYKKSLIYEAVTGKMEV